MRLGGYMVGVCRYWRPLQGLTDRFALQDGAARALKLAKTPGATGLGASVPVGWLRRTVLPPFVGL